MATFQHPVIGQEAICPDGLGRVIAYRDRFPDCWIQISTYVNDLSCQWAPENVQLVEIGECYSATAKTNK